MLSVIHTGKIITYRPRLYGKISNRGLAVKSSRPAPNVQYRGGDEMSKILELNIKVQVKWVNTQQNESRIGMCARLERFFGTPPKWHIYPNNFPPCIASSHNYGLQVVAVLLVRRSAGSHLRSSFNNLFFSPSHDEILLKKNSKITI